VDKHHPPCILGQPRKKRALYAFYLAAPGARILGCAVVEHLIRSLGAIPLENRYLLVGFFSYLPGFHFCLLGGFVVVIDR